MNVLNMEKEFKESALIAAMNHLLFLKRGCRKAIKSEIRLVATRPLVTQGRNYRHILHEQGSFIWLEGDVF